MAEPLPLPPLARLREVLNYEPDTGVLTWTDRATRHRGKPAGRIRTEADGYRVVKIDGVRYLAHRICYALHHGSDPYPMEIDHDNRNRADNRACNLLLATHRENSNNRGEYDRRTHIANAAKRKIVTITYPDGGTITARSQTLAAYILGQGRIQIHRAIARGGDLYHPHTRIPTGITVSYTRT